MDSTLAYATTPLALASLAIIAGVGILKLLVSGKNNALNRLITHYGFIVVLAFGILGNLLYFYSQRLASEALVFGNVVEAGTGVPLGRVVIDAGPHSRGMSGDDGQFVLAIPASRAQPSYTIHAVLPGFERATTTVQSASRMFSTIELKRKPWVNVLNFGAADAIVGHYLGLPELYLPLTINNPGTSPITLSNFSLSMTSPSGNKRQMIVGTSSPSMMGPWSLPLLYVQVKALERYSWVSGFIQYDQGVQSLSQRVTKILQGSPGFKQTGPQVGASYLSTELHEELLSAAEQNWFWEPGTSSIKLVCNDDSGRRYEISTGITLSEKQVASMKKITEYYKSGYGILFGSQLVPVGSAQPSQQVKLNPK
jgi:hypothetical protein